VTVTTLVTAAPLALDVYPVDGPSAVVPGTSLRLPSARRIPAAERCHGCAGTGVDFVAGTLAACYCMEPPPPAVPAPLPVTHLSSRSRAYTPRPGETYFVVTEIEV
jgi:hypothetical protein